MQGGSQRKSQFRKQKKLSGVWENTEYHHKRQKRQKFTKDGVMRDQCYETVRIGPEERPFDLKLLVFLDPKMLDIFIHRLGIAFVINGTRLKIQAFIFVSKVRNNETKSVLNKRN